MLTGEIVTPKEFAHEQALAKAIVSALGEFMDARTQDLPHRFRAPKLFAEYLTDWGTNSTYVTTPIYGGNTANQMTLQMTTRPTQHILEIIFTAADGMRLFTLEIEYGDAIQEKRQVLLP
jgi:ABC-type transporter lipoprotein component MlaA